MNGLFFCVVLRQVLVVIHLGRNPNLTIETGDTVGIAKQSLGCEL